MREINRALLYDIRTQRITDDLLAIKQLTKNCQKIIEVGSGTGRILKYLATTKNTVLTGIEIDSIMYEIGRQKCERNKNIRIINENFLKYRTSEKFDCVLFGFNVLTEFIDIPSRFAAINKAKQLLSDNGRIIITNDLPVFANWSKNNVKYEFPLSDPKLGKWICKINCSRDLINQISKCRVYYSQVDGSHPKVCDQYSSALLTRNELLVLYIASKLKIVAEYGSYDLVPLDANSQVVIHVLKTEKRAYSPLVISEGGNF